MTLSEMRQTILATVQTRKKASSELIFVNLVRFVDSNRAQFDNSTNYQTGSKTDFNYVHEYHRLKPFSSYSIFSAHS